MRFSALSLCVYTHSAVCCSVASVLQRGAERCSELQCVAMRCSVLQCVAVCVCTYRGGASMSNGDLSACTYPQWCCSVLQCVQCVAVCCSVLQHDVVHYSALLCVCTHCTGARAAKGDLFARSYPPWWCSVLQCVAVCCSVLQCVAVRCCALLCVAVRCCVSQCVCSVLQCVVVRLQYVAVRCCVLQCVAVFLHCVAV